MEKKILIIPFMILILGSTSCGVPAAPTANSTVPTTAAITTVATANQTIDQPASASLPSADGPLKAEVVSPIDVNLSWAGLSADKFLLEISVGGSEFGTLAELAGDASSYENFPALPDRIIQYRLTAFKGNNPEKPLLVEVQTPAQDPKPLTVLLVNDMVIPDPATMDLSSIDPESMDPADLASLFSPTLVSESADIGPEGGQVSVTSSNGVKYTYAIPAGALEDTLTFTIKPISSMEGAPLSGALLGAVQIEPVGLELNEPAVLTIEPALGGLATVDDLVAVFSFMPDGSEFTITDTYTNADSQAFLDTGKLAALMPPHDDWVMKPWDLPQTTTGPAGVGVTTRAAVRNQATSHPPTNRNSRTAQNNVAADDELAPLIAPEYLDFNQRSQGLSGWDDTLSLMSDMETKFNSAKDKNASQELMTKAIENLVDRIERNFKLNLNNCVSKDDYSAYYAAKSMKSQRSAFIKIIAARYQSKYGTRTVDDVLKKADRCNLRLKVNSIVTLKGPDIDLNLQIETEVPLKIHYDNNTGSVYYSGTGIIKYTNNDGVLGECKGAYITQGKGSFIVNKLYPVFAPSSATLIDFSLKRYTTTGTSKKFKIQCTGFNAMLPLPDGVDTWGGFYTVTKYENLEITDWLVSPQMAGRELASAATSTSKPLPGGSITENSNFYLNVNSQ